MRCTITSERAEKDDSEGGLPCNAFGSKHANMLLFRTDPTSRIVFKRAEFASRRFSSVRNAGYSLRICAGPGRRLCSSQATFCAMHALRDIGGGIASGQSTSASPQRGRLTPQSPRRTGRPRTQPPCSAHHVGMGALPPPHCIKPQDSPSAARTQRARPRALQRAAAQEADLNWTARWQRERRRGGKGGSAGRATGDFFHRQGAALLGPSALPQPSVSDARVCPSCPDAAAAAKEPRAHAADPKGEGGGEGTTGARRPAPARAPSDSAPRTGLPGPARRGPGPRSRD